MTKSKKPCMIVVMGITGSGKSFLVNRLAGTEAVREGAGTVICHLVPAKIGSRDVILVDTPGFNDSSRSDGEILSEISNTLVAQYKLGCELKGVIYVHRISDLRFDNSAFKTLQIVQRICGDMALKNVILLTNRWDKVQESEGIERERKLREQKWRYMLDKGSKIERFYGGKESAQALIAQLLKGSNVVLELQREIIEDGKRLDKTSAGTFVVDALQVKQKELQSDLESLADMLDAEEGQQKLRYEQDYKLCLEKLNAIAEQQSVLKVDIGQKVDAKLDEIKLQKKKKSKWQKGGKVALNILPTAIALIGMLAGIPTGFGGIEELVTGADESTDNNMSQLLDG